MLTRRKLHPYQFRIAEHVCQSDRSMLHVAMSLGKTVSVLTAIADLYNRAQLSGVLVVAPRRVAELVWRQEAEKWSHTAHLRVCVLRGQSKNVLARNLLRPFDIWVINYEALGWLAGEINKLFLSRGRYPPFDMLVFDEVTRAKNTNGARISNLYARNAQGYRLIDYIPRRVGLTGTPAPNGYQDLHGQYYAIDDGAALEVSEDVFFQKYFSVDPWTGRKELALGAKEQIHERIAPITLTLRDEDYLRLPPYIINDIWVELPEKIQTEYERFEETMFAELGSGTLEVFNKNSVSMKCRQIANGMVIDTPTKTWEPVHDAKLEALDEVVEEAGGSPLLVSYVFTADLERIKERYKKRLEIGYIGPGVSDIEALEVYGRWNRGDYQMLLLHWASGGHGLNLQHGGHQVVWFGVDWPAEGYLQLNARLRRQGQTNYRVVIHRILARNTVDEAMKMRLEDKLVGQDDLTASLVALQEYREKKHK